MTGHRAEQAAGLVPPSAAEPDGEAGQGSKCQPDVRTLLQNISFSNSKKIVDIYIYICLEYL